MVPWAPRPRGWDADVRVRAPPAHGPGSAGADGGAGAGGGLPWPSCRVIRAIIRRGLQDGAAELYPISAGQGGGGVPRPQLQRFWGAARAVQPGLSPAASLLHFYFLAPSSTLTTSVALEPVTELRASVSHL